MNNILKYYKAILGGLFCVAITLLGGIQFYDRITQDFVRIGDHASAQEATGQKIQVVDKRSIENGADLLYIHKRGTRRELGQAKEELRMLEDFDDVAEERSELINEIADLETELEDFTAQINALKSPP